MDYTNILSYIFTLVPSFVAICTSLASIIKVVKSVKDLKGEVHDKVENEELKKQLQIALQDSEDLKRLLKKDIEAKTKVKED